ncbi:hypothetical protein LNS57_002246 [Listeria monocytogenes]|nr:hypothetical protein [Listeria monocytogenes]
MEVKLEKSNLIIWMARLCKLCMTNSKNQSAIIQKLAIWAEVETHK